MRTFAIVNQKGGVGKTTLTLNLGAAFAERGLRTLVVDLDPQGYTTAGCGQIGEYDREGPSLAGALMGELDATEIKSLVRRTLDGYDLLPSNLDMFTIEARLTGQRGREFRLRQVLATFEDEYDFVLIDCPASLGPLTDNAIVAVGEIIVPMLPDGLSIRALELLLDQIDSIRGALGVEVTIAGLVINKYDDTLAAARVDEDLKTIPVPVLARIRKRVAATNSWEAGRSVLTTDPTGHITVAVRELASVLMGERKEGE
jgi:chromosome partitioning protein